MAKHKVGDRFVIEIDSVMTNHKGTLYGIRGFTSLVMTDLGLEQLEKYPKSTLGDAYDKGYEQAIYDAKQLIRTVYAKHAFARQAELDDVLGKLDEKTVEELSS